jgi:hypothetical protein
MNLWIKCAKCGFELGDHSAIGNFCPKNIEDKSGKFTKDEFEKVNEK